MAGVEVASAFRGFLQSKAISAAMDRATVHVRTRCPCVPKEDIHGAAHTGFLK